MIQNPTKEIAEEIRETVIDSIISLFDSQSAVMRKVTFIPFFIGDVTSPLIAQHATGRMGRSLEPIDHEPFDPLFSLAKIAKSPVPLETLEAKLFLQMSVILETG